MRAYNLRSLKLPKLTRFGLSVFTRVLTTQMGKALLLNSLLKSGGVMRLRQITLTESPTLLPLVPVNGRVQATPEGFTPGAPPEGFPFRTSRDYTRAYQRGETTPLEVAKGVLAAIQASDQGQKPLRLFISVLPEDLLAQARAASERYRGGAALGPLDGVPVAVKDELDMQPYPTTGGTSFLGSAPARQDATVVARLRAAGALLVGKTNMYEFGVNPNGFNRHHGTVRNPYNLDCDPGGSSSGSAAAVAAGITPLAIGADAGGSIRIPSGLCGVVGLKPTFGRVCEFGAVPICWSMAHLGPIAASVEDAALGYMLMAGPDQRDVNTLVQPPVDLSGWNQPNLRGVRIGIYREWFEHAEPEVVRICRTLADRLVEAGAEVREIEIPELDEMRIAQAVSILAEMSLNMQAHRQHQSQLSDPVRINLSLGDALTASDYLTAQQIRTRALAIFQRVFQEVDIILTPATAISAPPFPPGGLSGGYSDLSTVTELMRFIFPANLCGLPAITFPAGYDSSALPVGMQAVGRHWEENLLLRVAYNAERVVSRRTPPNYYPSI